MPFSYFQRTLMILYMWLYCKKRNVQYNLQLRQNRSGYSINFTTPHLPLSKPPYTSLFPRHQVYLHNKGTFYKKSFSIVITVFNKNSNCVQKTFYLTPKEFFVILFFGIVSNGIVSFVIVSPPISSFGNSVAYKVSNMFSIQGSTVPLIPAFYYRIILHAFVSSLTLKQCFIFQ